MRKYFLFGVFGAGLSLASACNSDEVNRTPASPSVRQLLGSLCDVSMRCCSRNEVDFLIGPFVDAENCIDRLYERAARQAVSTYSLETLASLAGIAVLVPNVGALDQAVQDGRTAVDQAALQACREHLAEVACNQPLDEELEEPEGCQPLPAPDPEAEEMPCDPTKLFVGRVGPGGECTSIGGFSIECREGLICAGGLGLGITGRCVEAQQEGEVCSSDNECAKDLYCSGLEGTCQAPKKEGEVCVFSDRNDPAPPAETLLVRCEGHLFCDPITNTCVARCQSGAQCLTDDDCDAEQELTCILDRCSAPRAEGLPCSVDTHCQEGLYCGPDLLEPGKSVCTIAKADAASCTRHEECANGFCNLGTSQCAAPAAVGDPCPSGLDEQCDGGRCVPEEPSGASTFCLDGTECPITGTCDVFGQCGTYCVAIKSDGATCTLDNECESGECVAGICRTTPLALGVACDDPTDCESGFCSYDADERICAELPLALNAPCASSFECETGVCFADTPGEPAKCIIGLGEGEACGALDQPPCNPQLFYCDTEEQDPPVCVPLKETGEVCKSSIQCRGDCVIRHGRQMCSAAAPVDDAVCSGKDPVAVPETTTQALFGAR